LTLTLELLPAKVLLLTTSVPLLAMPPPLRPTLLAAAIVRFWTVNVTPLFTKKTPTLCPPLIVIRLPPSMVVSALMLLVLVTVIVVEPPQLKVTVPSKLPPPGRQALSAASVQLAPVPLPTTHATVGVPLGSDVDVLAGGGVLVGKFVGVGVGAAQVPLAQDPLLHWEPLVQVVPSLQPTLWPQHVFKTLSQDPLLQSAELLQAAASAQQLQPDVHGGVAVGVAAGVGVPGELNS